MEVHYKKELVKKIEEFSEASKVPLEFFLTVMTIAVQSGASRQEHQKKEIHIMKQTTDYAENKTIINSTIS